LSYGEIEIEEYRANDHENPTHTVTVYSTSRRQVIDTVREERAQGGGYLA
jgi:hypothetical protein